MRSAPFHSHYDGACILILQSRIIYGYVNTLRPADESLMVVNTVRKRKFIDGVEQCVIIYCCSGKLHLSLECCITRPSCGLNRHLIF